MRLNANNSIVVDIFDTVLRRTITNSNVFTLGNYHDIIFSWKSGNHPVVYVDGLAVGLASSAVVNTPANDTSFNLIFGNKSNGGGVFGGTFRRLRIWRNYAITQSDATTLANGGTIAAVPTGQYLFTEGSGTTTSDSSGHGNTATIVKPAYWNNTIFDVAFNSGNDTFMYALTVFNGKLYAGAGYHASRIYSYDGNSWSTVYSGLSGLWTCCQFICL